MKHARPLAAALATLGAALTLAAAPRQDHPVGYDDTPYLPGGEWRVHDKDRPAPRSVRPGNGGSAPSDAIVLFNGGGLDSWTSGGGPAKWAVEDGAMVVNGTGSIETRQQFGDCQLHLEWAAPAEVASESQGRGNSGLFLMGRYEVQILDSYANRTYADGQAGAMYGQYPPLVNACRKPGEWQSYDVVFRAPRFDDEGALVRPARVTVLQNGVLVQDAREFLGATAHRAVAQYSAHPPKGPIGLQDHGNPVRFRNVWVRPLAPLD